MIDERTACRWLVPSLILGLAGQRFFRTPAVPFKLFQFSGEIEFDYLLRGIRENSRD